jgi:hypothetical protein
MDELKWDQESLKPLISSIKGPNYIKTLQTIRNDKWGLPITEEIITGIEPLFVKDYQGTKKSFWEGEVEDFDKDVVEAITLIRDGGLKHISPREAKSFVKEFAIKEGLTPTEAQIKAASDLLTNLGREIVRAKITDEIKISDDDIKLLTDKLSV